MNWKLLGEYAVLLVVIFVLVVSTFRLIGPHVDLVFSHMR